MDPGGCKGEEAVVAEKGGGHTGECTQRMLPQSHWLGKREGLNFMSSCNQGGLKAGVLKVSGLGWNRLGGH